MTLQEITAKMKEGAAKKSPFGNTVKFSTDQGVVFIDGNANPPNVSNDDTAADCTLIAKECYCGAQPIIGIAKTAAPAAASCEMNCHRTSSAVGRTKLRPLSRLRQ